MCIRGGTVPCDVPLVFRPKHFGCSFLLGRYGFWVVGFGVVVGRGVVGLIVWTLVVACGGVCESHNVLLSVVGDCGLIGRCDVFFFFFFPLSPCMFSCGRAIQGVGIEDHRRLPLYILCMCSYRLGLV